MYNEYGVKGGEAIQSRSGRGNILAVVGAQFGSE